MSMEQDDQHWHLDKRVNISHIVATVLLVVGGFTMIHQLDARITVNEIRIEEIQRQTLEYQRRSIESMNRIEDKVDRLIERQQAQQR